MPHIVIDPVGLDELGLGCGQYRYVVDLISGLAELKPLARFTVLGAKPSPPVELVPVFTLNDRWMYRYYPRPTGRGAWIRDQFKLAACLASIRADLYHGLHSLIPVLALCKTVITIYDLMRELFPEYAESLARSRSYRLYRWATRHRATRVICISRTTAEDVHRRWGIPRSRLDVVHLGTTFVEVHDSGRQQSIANSGTIIVSPYNLEPRKNLVGLIEAFRLLLTEYPQAQLVLYGRAAVTPDREKAFESLVAPLGIAVVRTGYLSDNDLKDLYQRATLFVFPSLYEGFGYPVLEAMAAGTCVVARNLSAMAEVVGPAGLLIDTTDHSALFRAISYCLGHESEREQFGDAAASRAREFTVHQMAFNTLTSYGAALRCQIDTERQ